MALGEITVQQCKSSSYLALFSAVACFQMILTTAVMYGYASLLVVFKDLKLYQSECAASEVTTTPHLFNSTINGNSSTGGNSVIYGDTDDLFCPARDKSLNLPFAIGMVLQSVVKIPIGNLVDTFGAKSSQYLGWYDSQNLLYG